MLEPSGGNFFQGPWRSLFLWAEIHQDEKARGPGRQASAKLEKTGF
jgi:hypothetical protein